MLGFALDTMTDSPPGITEESNAPGELICREAFPIQPVGFWPLKGYGHDEEEVKKAEERFRESYFKDDQGIWCTSFLTQLCSVLEYIS